MIKGARLNLTPLTEDDIELVRKWRNAYSQSFFDATHITKEQQVMWYQKYRESSTDQMFVMRKKDGTPIGTIALYDISISDRTAKVGRVMLIDEERGHGYAEEAVRLILDEADKLRLYKLKVEVYLDNIDAISVYAKCGFKTTSRPIILLERVNQDIDWKKPVELRVYDEEAEL